MFKTQIIHTKDEFKQLRNNWNELLERSGSDTVFLSHEWLSIWLDTFGLNTKCFMIMVIKGNKIIAIAPLVIVNHVKCGIRIRKLQFAGSPQADYSDFIIDELREQCVEAIFKCIIRNVKYWDIIELWHLLNDSPNWQYLIKNIDNRELSYWKYQATVAPYILLDQKFETYYLKISKKLRYDIRRNIKRLKARGILNYAILQSRDDRLEHLPQFMDTLINRTTAAGRAVHTSTNLLLGKFFTALINDSEASKLILFSRHNHNGQNIAFHFGFLYKSKVYWYKPTFDPAYGQYSVGSIHLRDSIEYAIGENITEFDLLLGDEPYKMRWTAKKRSVFNINLYNKSIKSKIMKIWFTTVKPQLRDNIIIIKCLNIIRK
jgi:CelD/BcsL family acetyltransferase involved in cellulose biosynthesis